MKLASLGILCALTVVAHAHLDNSIIRGRIRKHMKQFRACYERELANQPNLEGKVVARFTIGQDGTVIASTAEGLPKVDACVARVIKTIRFPPMPKDKASLQITYPFLFQPDRR